MNTKFTIIQRLRILKSYILKEFRGILFPAFRRRATRYSEDHTRGNVIHRIGGAISEDQHNSYVAEEFMDNSKPL